MENNKNKEKLRVIKKEKKKENIQDRGSEEEKEEVSKSGSESVTENNRTNLHLPERGTQELTSPRGFLNGVSEKILIVETYSKVK